MLTTYQQANLDTSLLHMPHNNRTDKYVAIDSRDVLSNMEKLGFNFIEDTQPSWFIIDGKVRRNRIGYQKHKLVNNNNYNKDKTAHQICIDSGWFRIYDCGAKKYSLTKNSN